MKTALVSRRNRFIKWGSFLMALSLFWFTLFLKIPDTFSRYFHDYSLTLFLIVLVLYYLAFQLPDSHGIPVSLALTMVLSALSLSYLWSAGFSDNFMISGLLPYKDAKNYFVGTELLLNGFPMVGAGQATERPLFPGFLSGILLLTGHNLKITLAIIAQLVATGIYFSTRQILNSFGALAASFYATLLYFHIKPFIGYSMSETLGFISGCFAFTMIWLAAKSNRIKWTDLVLGILGLMVAVSARAGAFFIFPMVVLWIGWIFRGEKQFSIKMAALALVGVLIGYFLVNSVYSRLLGIPPGQAFGNFSYAMYGQVRGGTGWHSAVEELGTRNPSVVYRETWEFFLKHPFSLFIGFAKSYKDFFLPGGRSIFPFGNLNWLNGIPWVMALILLILGLIRSFRDIRSNLSSLLVAGFMGIFLSIPFLPPIDGGSRFYASTAPYFFALPALGVSWFSKITQRTRSSSDNSLSDLTASRYISIAMVMLTLLIPPLIYSLAQKPASTMPGCPAGQEPFYIKYHPGTYVDFVKNGSTSCGSVPEVCQDDFERNNTEISTDYFYQFLLRSMKEDESDVRLIPAFNFANGRFHYFYVSPDKFEEHLSFGTISGCAVETWTKNQTIYQVESLSPENK